MAQTYLPGTLRDRIEDLMKERNITQAELAETIGLSESAFSRFLSGKTSKLGNAYIIRIARKFKVSTDFLLGVTDVPDRKNYDIEELGLTVQAARNLYTQKVDPRVVTYLLESPRFADTAAQIARYLEGSLAAGYAAQNAIYEGVAQILDKRKVSKASKEIRTMLTPNYQHDLTTIRTSFMEAVQEIKTDVELEVAADNLTKEQFKRITKELQKGICAKTPSITPKEWAEAVTAPIAAVEIVPRSTRDNLTLALTRFAEDLKQADDQ